MSACWIRSEALDPSARISAQLLLPFQRSMTTGLLSVPTMLMDPPAWAVIDTLLVIFTFAPATIVSEMFVGTITFERTSTVPDQVVFSVKVPPAKSVGVFR